MTEITLLVGKDVMYAHAQDNSSISCLGWNYITRGKVYSQTLFLMMQVAPHNYAQILLGHMTGNNLEVLDLLLITPLPPH